MPQRATKIKVADGREALAVTSAAFYQHPSTKLKLIGVTGTNGKTTSLFMVKHILETAGIKTGLIGTVRYEIGDRVLSRATDDAGSAWKCSRCWRRCSGLVARLVSWRSAPTLWIKNGSTGSTLMWASSPI